MKSIGRRWLACLSGALVAGGVAWGGTAAAQAQTELRVFLSNQHRPDVMRQAFDIYQQRNPNVRIVHETGGNTSELQAQYLNTVLSAKDPSLDIFLIDVIRPAQFGAAQWAVPMNDQVGPLEPFLKRYLPAYAEANVIDGQLVSLPAFADAMFLYYRKDLLEKYGLQPPKTWDELAVSARKILDGEKDPNLQGVSFQGRAIEGAVCTFLLPYWSQGKELVKDGRLTMDRAAGERSLQMWLDLVDKGVAKRNIAEVATDDTRREFQNGQVAFAVLWSYGWSLFQGADSAVKDKVGVAVLPAMTGGTNPSCIGGWQWAVSAFSTKRAAAIDLVKFMSSPEVSELLAVRGSLMPVFPEVFTDPDVVAAVPWFAQARPVVEQARARPVTPRYNEVSEIIRTNVNAVMGRSVTPQAAVADMEGRLRRVLR